MVLFMKKVIVIGVTGSGKSTLAEKLSAKLGYPYIQLDKLFWKANWEITPDDEFFKKISKAIDSEEWVLDGNYTRTNHLTLTVADTVVWIDLPFWLTFYQNFSRSVKRAIVRNELWEGTGNRESFLRMFSSDSIIKWLFKTYSPHKKRNEARLSSPNYSHINFYRLRSRKEVNHFLKTVIEKS